MDILFKSVKIFDPGSDYHNNIIDLYIKDGEIKAIGKNLVENAEEVFEIEGLCVSGGWLDLFAFTGEPGLEYKEDLYSVTAAAAAGGFTEILCIPNTDPVLQTKNAVSFLKNASKTSPVTVHAMPAVTVNTEGKDLTEMIDLQQAGAVAFSDGMHGLQNADVLIKALQYTQFFDGLVINKPENTRLNEFGQIHEGKVSTLLGLKGLPALAEEITVARDLQLLEYAGGKLHITLVSTAESIDLIRKAKANGLQVSCSVASYQAMFTDETMEQFDSNFKINPPFRTDKDVAAIKQGLKDGTIDALVSGHLPQDPESKNLEFDLADFGIINLETAFAVANQSFTETTGLEMLIHALVTAPRKIINVPVPVIKQGEKANLTFFHPDKEWIFDQDTIKSKAMNSPFIGKTLRGKVLGIIHNNKTVFNPNF